MHASATSTAQVFHDFGESSVPLPGCILTSAIVKEQAW